MILRLRSSFPLALVLVGLSGCSEDEKPQPTDEAEAPQQKSPPSEAPSEPETPAEPAEDPLADWDDTPKPDLGGEDPPAPATAAFEGPCKLRWIEGPILRFTYEPDSVSVRIDNDADGTSDLCGKSTRADGRITSIAVDEGCDRKTDFKISPTHDAEANLATATYTKTVEGKKTKRGLTLVTLPVYAGLPGGYPLQAKRDAIELEIEAGKVMSAKLTEPEEGPPLSVSFGYDEQGRLSRIEEDIDLDGAIDRRFAYKYDAVGNVEQMRYVMGRGEGAKKGFARVDYRCWATPAAPTEAPAPSPTPAKTPD